MVALFHYHLLILRVEFSFFRLRYGAVPFVFYVNIYLEQKGSARWIFQTVSGRKDLERTIQEIVCVISDGFLRIQSEAIYST